MTRKAFFAWERGLRGPIPAVYYDSMPTGSNGSRIIAHREIPEGTAHGAAFPGADESPNFGALAEWFPAPVATPETPADA